MVVLDEDGKPCRTCTSLDDFQNAMFGNAPSAEPPKRAAPALSEAPPAFFDDPPDSLELGQKTWTFLHSVAAYFPQKPTPTQQDEMQTFLKTFSHFYPCKPCAQDFEAYLDEHRPNVADRKSLSLWMCDAHNAVNSKLGKPTFDCRLWQARWRDGWEEFLESQKK